MKHTLIDAETGTQLPQEESSGTQPTTPTMAAAARPAAISPVEEPENLLPVKRNGGLFRPLSGQQISCRDLEKAISEQLATEDMHTRASATAALRAGVLFHIYRQSLNLKRDEFYAQCEAKFKIGHTTIN